MRVYPGVDASQKRAVVGRWGAGASSFRGCSLRVGSATMQASFITLGNRMNHWAYLGIAIVAEVIATSALKSSESFSKLGPSLVVVAGYGCAFLFLSLTLKTLPVGVAYAIWSGLGIVLISLASLVLFGQKLDLPAILGMGLIIAGVVVMNVFSKSVSH